MTLRLLLPLLAILVLAAACSGGRSGTGGRDASTDEATTAPTATDAPRSEIPTEDAPARVSTPIEGGTFVRVWADPPTLDPHLTTDATSAVIIVEVFGGLVTISPDLQIVPDLATWDVTPDGTVYTFRIREDAKFHDGKPVTALDVKWSMERAADPATASPVVDQYLGDIVGVKEKLEGEAAEISGVRVLDQQTLEITIDAAKSYFLAKLTYPTAFVLDRENVESSRRWFREPNGTGPFRLTEYTPGERMILTKNELYHLGPPMLERVRFILSGGTSMLMYENDEIHIAGVGLADLDRVLDPSNPLNTELHRAPPRFSTDYIGMNVTEPPFDDPKVRQALNYAIDKELIASEIMAGLVVPANGILPRDFPAYNAGLAGYEYNPEKARQLLKESKYGDDMEQFPRIILTTAGSFGSSVDLDMEVILEMWKQNLGIEVLVQQTEFATYLQDLNKRRFQMFQIGWIADYPDPENFLDILFHSESSNNHTGFSNDEADRLLELARVEPDQAARYELYRQAEEVIMAEAPWVPLWYSGEQYVLLKPSVKNYHLSQLIIPLLRYVELTE
ncbi:MAG: peptide ABC transporter substrate-binding protein [Dehalococcoidia bacterium]|nr:peptide ABC transporter substrate-binding protein [Dehalococcoidia bacterium]